jgi:hypothetical protein
MMMLLLLLLLLLLMLLLLLLLLPPPLPLFLPPIDVIDTSSAKVIWSIEEFKRCQIERSGNRG